ncbi:MAG: hypothetical protein JRJ49_08890 [Deltaproteobacteria bacterium]|nr:hypothetical protein [Deltaproteobacteria bacterium]
MAADQLIDDAIANKQIQQLDLTVFPAIFLYRQFIELFLKQCILEFSQEEVDFKKLNHNLIAIWERFVKLMPPESKDDKKTFEAARKYIQEFNREDPNSFSFRYPINKSKEVIFDKERRINIKHFKDRMAELEEFLDFQYYQMSELEQNSDFF